MDGGYRRGAVWGALSAAILDGIGSAGGRISDEDNVRGDVVELDVVEDEHKEQKTMSHVSQNNNSSLAWVAHLGTKSRR
uniref:Uncharacterized protein n=1 Tax=Romanomermis culicivorax TaxID=13658 RepID=A0A915KAV7_ROMCU